MFWLKKRERFVLVIRFASRSDALGSCLRGLQGTNQRERKWRSRWHKRRIFGQRAIHAGDGRLFDRRIHLDDCS